MNAVIAQIVAIATTIGFLGLMCFQILLALGFPFGQVVWGGKYIKLPPGLRIASIFSVAIYVLASILVLERAAIVSVINKSTLLSEIHSLIQRIFILIGIFHKMKECAATEMPH